VDLAEVAEVIKSSLSIPFFFGNFFQPNAEWEFYLFCLLLSSVLPFSNYLQDCEISEKIAALGIPYPASGD